MTREYKIVLDDYKEKNIFSLGKEFYGKSRNGDEISFTNYYMQKNGKPFFAVSGEIHFSRMSEDRWEDELSKMKQGGINVVATYVFWNHHEEEEGCFDFEGRKDIRRFVLLCQKYGLYVILRVGPFDHGEVRNGGLPDWLYGKPFVVRHTNAGFLYYTERLYRRIAKEVEGLFFKDNGPIIGTQLDNEYMSSSAVWECTTGISDEWIFGGDEGNAYMLALKKLAPECGLTPVFYTCTGWGGAATPDSMIPLWGGYAYQPWLFYSYSGEHPSTKEYLYQDYHNNDVTDVYNFEPQYKPEDRPYSCCEMGGGMMCSYYYRFILPYKSIDAMANIKLASGCNFLGYYMYHGGSNPLGKHGMYLNEAQVPKISYDYQACLGEFGQVRESYRRLKTMHYFVQKYAEELCTMKTYLPEGASEIDPKDLDTLRYAVRTNGKSGYLFLNNFQDHEQTKPKKDVRVQIQMPQECLDFHSLGLDPDENCILPFHFDVDGIDLVLATAQPVTDLEIDGRKTYIFMIPDGMPSRFVWEDGVRVNGILCRAYYADAEKEADLFTVSKDGKEADILCISRSLSNQMYVMNGQLLFTDAAVIERDGAVYLEDTASVISVACYPKNRLAGCESVKEAETADALLGHYELAREEAFFTAKVEEVGPFRYTISFEGLKEKFTQENLKDLRMRIDYRGDIGQLFLNGRMINDNFSNHDIWEIGLKQFVSELDTEAITLYIAPLKEDAKVNVESTMAARMEEVNTVYAQLRSISFAPVYERKLFEF